MKSRVITSNNIGKPEPIVVSIQCRSVTVCEDPTVKGFPTTALRVKGIDSGSEYVGIAPGVSFVFKRSDAQPGFTRGEIVGFVETVQGSTTIQIVEQ